VASAFFHAFILLAVAVMVVRIAAPVEDSLKVTWIEPIAPPKIEEPGGGSGPAPKPEVKKPLPKPAVKPKPRPKPVVKVEKPVEPVKINPLAEKSVPVAPPDNSVSAKVAQNEYVDLPQLSSLTGGAGSGSGRGRGGLLGDGVGSGVAPRRPIVYLARSMYNPKREDLETYDKMFWHVIDQWELPEKYRERSDLVATVNVRFDREGKITKFKFVRKSGVPEYDDTVIRAVVAANPLPKPTREFYQRFFDSGIDFIIEPRKIYFYEWPDPYADKKGRFGF
jgi:periplasmic protein TonB